MIPVIKLSRGMGSLTTKTHCVMAATSIVAGEPFSDVLGCVDPVINGALICANDAMSDEMRNTLLVDLPWQIIGTTSRDNKPTRQRFYMLIDWVVHHVFRAAAAEMLFGFGGAAERGFSSLPKIQDLATLHAAQAHVTDYLACVRGAWAWRPMLHEFDSSVLDFERLVIFKLASAYNWIDCARKFTRVAAIASNFNATLESVIWPSFRKLIDDMVAVYREDLECKKVSCVDGNLSVPDHCNKYCCHEASPVC